MALTTRGHDQHRWRMPMSEEVAQKVCLTCGKADRFSSGGCRVCVLANQAARYAARRSADPSGLHAKQLWRDFRMPLEEWQRLYAAQGGVCALCGRPETAFDRRTGTTKRLSVDHCHRTHIVRGLLCRLCNQLIGYLEKRLAQPEVALEYLAKLRPIAHVLPTTAAYFRAAV